MEYNTNLVEYVDMPLTNIEGWLENQTRPLRRLRFAKNILVA